MHADADSDEFHIIHKLQSLPLDNPSWDPSHDLTDPFERQYEEAIAQASEDIYAAACDADTSANTATPDPSLAGRMATDVDNNET